MTSLVINTLKGESAVIYLAGMFIYGIECIDPMVGIQYG